MLTWTPSQNVAPAYRALFDRCREGEPAVDTADALLFLASFGLPRAIVKRIWALADATGTGSVGYDRFVVALRLVSMAQAGAEVSEAAFAAMQRMDLPPPRLPGAAAPPAQGHVQHPVEDDAEFGGFAAAPAAAALPSSQPSQADDDGFGDFAGAGTTSAGPSRPQAGAVSTGGSHPAVAGPGLASSGGGSSSGGRQGAPGSFEELLLWPASGSLLGPGLPPPAPAAPPLVQQSAAPTPRRLSTLAAAPLGAGGANPPLTRVLPALSGGGGASGAAHASLLDAALDSLLEPPTAPAAADSEFGDFQAPPSVPSTGGRFAAASRAVQQPHLVPGTSAVPDDDDEFGGFQAPPPPASAASGAPPGPPAGGLNAVLRGAALPSAVHDAFSAAASLSVVDSFGASFAGAAQSQAYAVPPPAAAPAATPATGAGELATTGKPTAGGGGIALKRSFGAPSSAPAPPPASTTSTSTPATDAFTVPAAAVPPRAPSSVAAAPAPAPPPAAPAPASAPAPAASSLRRGRAPASAASSPPSADVPHAAVMSLSAFVSAPPAAAAAAPATVAAPAAAAAPTPATAAAPAPARKPLDAWGASSLSSIAELRARPPPRRPDDMHVITAVSVLSAVLDAGAGFSRALSAELSALLQGSPTQQRPGAASPEMDAVGAAAVAAAVLRDAVVLARVAAACVAAATAVRATPDTRALVDAELLRARALADDAELSQALARSLEVPAATSLAPARPTGSGRAAPKPAPSAATGAADNTQVEAAAVLAAGPQPGRVVAAPDVEAHNSTVVKRSGALVVDDPFASVPASHPAPVAAAATLPALPTAPAPAPAAPPRASANVIDDVFGSLVGGVEAEDDEFGAFDSAPPAVPPPVHAPQSVPIAPSLTIPPAAVPANPPAASLAPVAAPAQSDDDDFGDFDAAPISQTDIARSAPVAFPPPVAAALPDFVSTSAGVAAASSALPEVTPSEDAFGDFDAAPPAIPAPSTAPFAISWGDPAATAPASPPAPSLGPPPAPVESDDEDDFGAFGAAPAPPSAVGPPVVLAPPQLPPTAPSSVAVDAAARGPSTITEDVFGAIDSVDISANEPLAPPSMSLAISWAVPAAPAPASPAAASSLNPPPAPTEQDDDDFGDFGAAAGPPPVDPPSAPSALPLPTATAISHVHDSVTQTAPEFQAEGAVDSDDEDEFGAFGDATQGAVIASAAAPSTPSPSPPPIRPDLGDVDGFDVAFGGAVQGDPVVTLPKNAVPDSSPPPAPPPTPADSGDEDDDFGAFGTAPPLPQRPPAASIQHVDAAPTLPVGALAPETLCPPPVSTDEDDPFGAPPAPPADAGFVSQLPPQPPQPSVALLSLADALGELDWGDAGASADPLPPPPPLPVAPLPASVGAPAALAVPAVTQATVLRTPLASWDPPQQCPPPVLDAVALLRSDPASPCLAAACAALRTTALRAVLAASAAAKAAAVEEDRLEDALAAKQRGVAAARLVERSLADAARLPLPPPSPVQPPSGPAWLELAAAAAAGGGSTLLRLAAEVDAEVGGAHPPAAAADQAEASVAAEAGQAVASELGLSKDGAGAPRGAPPSLADLAAASAPAALALQRLLALAAAVVPGPGQLPPRATPASPSAQLLRDWLALARYVTDAAGRLRRAVADTLREGSGLDLSSPAAALRSCRGSSIAAAVASAAAASAALACETAALAVTAEVLGRVAAAAVAAGTGGLEAREGLATAAAALSDAAAPVIVLVGAAGGGAVSATAPLAAAVARLMASQARLGAALQQQQQQQQQPEGARLQPLPSALTAAPSAGLRALVAAELCSARAWVLWGHAWPLPPEAPLSAGPGAAATGLGAVAALAGAGCPVCLGAVDAGTEEGSHAACTLLRGAALAARASSY